MSEKQTVAADVVRDGLGHCFLAVRLETGPGTAFLWPHFIPEGTPVRVTVEIGGRKRKGEK